MSGDFVFWDFGSNNERCWFRPLGLKFGVQAQKLIQEAMPYGFKPTEKDDFILVQVVMEWIEILTEANEFEKYRDWIIHGIRYLFNKDYPIGPFLPPPIDKVYSLREKKREKKPEFTYQGIIEAAKEGKQTFSFEEILASPVEIK